MTESTPKGTAVFVSLDQFMIDHGFRWIGVEQNTEGLENS